MIAHYRKGSAVIELFPVACGPVLGAALGGLRPSIRPAVGTLFVVILGVLATVVSESSG